MRKRYSFKPSKYKFRGKRQPTGKRGMEISCIGKIRWHDKHQAKSHAEDVNNRLIGDRPVRPYKCHFSPKDSLHYHVGRSPKVA